jgi:hypothetical protein
MTELEKMKQRRNHWIGRSLLLQDRLRRADELVKQLQRVRLASDDVIASQSEIIQMQEVVIQEFKTLSAKAERLIRRLQKGLKSDHTEVSGIRKALLLSLVENANLQGVQTRLSKHLERLQRFDRRSPTRLPLFNGALNLHKDGMGQLEALKNANAGLISIKSRDAFNPLDITSNSPLYRSFCRFVKVQFKNPK